VQGPFRAGVDIEVVVPTGLPDDHTGDKYAMYSSILASEPHGLVIRAPVGPDGPLNLQPGTEMTLWRYKGAATYVTIVTVVEQCPGDPPLLVTTSPSKTRELVKRGYFRVQAEIPFKTGHLRGKVKNISGSGILATVPPGSLSVGRTYPVDIELPGSKGPTTARARVVRVVSGKEEDLVGMHFDSIDEKVREAIIRYIFGRQRELLRLGELGSPWRRL
jgi:c-di-GMP-binding flagellar brake protein YcgR